MSRDDAPTLIFETVDGLSRATLAGPATLGRDAGCDVRIEHPTVSRHHARILRDGEGRWRYEDLASRNGTRASGDTVDLADGATLRLGRVRAWFFRDAPPADWRPDDEPPASQGKLVRCRCGHVGWAPAYTSGLTVRCKACRGRIIVGDDREPTRSEPRAIASQCPGCRTTIAADERGHVCDACGVHMHAECHRELGGCATYGCPRVNELRARGGDGEPAAEVDGGPAEPLPTPLAISRRDRWPIVTWSLVGLVTFGVPAFGWAIVALARRRAARAAILGAAGGGVLGVATSFVVWSLALNDGAWPW